MNIEIANRLVELRKKNNLSQEELAARIGVSRQAVSKWERAEASPDTDNLILLARLYRVSLDELLRVHNVPQLEEPPAVDAAEPVRVPELSAVGGYEEPVPRDKISQEADHSVFRETSASHDVPFGDGTGQMGVVPDGERQESNGSNLPSSDRQTADAENPSAGNWKFRRWLVFPYPILATIVFLLLGFLGDWWHPGWVVFLTIPVYYGIVDTVAKKKPFLTAIYPILTIIVFLLLGFLGGWWAWAWIVFLTIPLYYALFPDQPHFHDDP